MAITKETQIAKIEVVGKYKALQIATDTIIKENDVEISRTTVSYTHLRAHET